MRKHRPAGEKPLYEERLNAAKADYEARYGKETN
jgi:hypothetical protein